MPDIRAWADQLDERQPIYLQIVDRFKGCVIKGEMPPGERIPSIREVAAAVRVNPNTVHRAYQEMEREGLIYSQRGMGYYVTEDEKVMDAIKSAMAGEAIDRFIADMFSMGFDGDQIMCIVGDALENRQVKEARDDG